MRPVLLVNQKRVVMVGSAKASKTTCAGRRIRRPVETVGGLVKVEDIGNILLRLSLRRLGSYFDSGGS